jgi:hypothetical protein
LAGTNGVEERERERERERKANRDGRMKREENEARQDTQRYDTYV